LFENDIFDFALFSFNGIDHIDCHDRIKVFQEVKRVLRKSGSFCFSSHNVNCIDQTYFSIKELTSLKELLFCLWHNPRKSLTRILELIRMKVVFVNEKYICYKDYVDINPIIRGGMNSVITYVKPDWQMNVLKQIGFTKFRLFGLCGREITDFDGELKEVCDRWIYYLCEK